MTLLTVLGGSDKMERSETEKNVIIPEAEKKYSEGKE